MTDAAPSLADAAPSPRDDASRPAVSIVLATYNRPAVLAFAIRSVLAQDVADWELIVVGDRCSEATGALVDSFADPRIRYVNLALNYGEQSGPNNVGIARARGRTIAFLNHDDCWFPDHLRASMDWLQATGADGVIARAATVAPSSPSGDEGYAWCTFLTGEGRRGRYDPAHTNAPISTVLLKSSVARAVGAWRPASDVHGSSSQQWLFRIWRRGFDIRTMPHLTVLQFASGLRTGSYLAADAPEHAFFEPQFARPLDLRMLLLDRRWAPSRPLWRRLAKSIALVGLRAAAHLGRAPSELIPRLLLGYRRGTFINKLRGVRGLSPMPDHEPSAAALRDRYAAEQAAQRTPSQPPPSS